MVVKSFKIKQLVPETNSELHTKYGKLDKIKQKLSVLSLY